MSPDVLNDLKRYKADAMRSQDAGRQIIYTRAIDEIERLRAARHAKPVLRERERCAKIAEAYAETSRRGSSVSSMAEDAWGAVAGDEIAKLIRRAHEQSSACALCGAIPEGARPVTCNRSDCPQRKFREPRPDRQSDEQAQDRKP